MRNIWGQDQQFYIEHSVYDDRTLTSTENTFKNL